MKQKLILLITFITISYASLGQVKIGDNPNLINPNSILELESPDKVLVISRLTTDQMNAISNPVRGSVLYNIDEKCVFTFNESSWVSLCGNSKNLTITNGVTAPENPSLGDYWVNGNISSIWNGADWVIISRSPLVGNAVPSSSTVTTANAGDIYVNRSNGDLYTFDGTNWIKQGAEGSVIETENGISLNPTTKKIELGGNLIKPTVIRTTASNTLAIEGLEDGDTTQDDLVTINRTNGTLRKINSRNLFREDISRFSVTSNSQTSFDLTTIGKVLYSTDKVNLYRNGVRIYDISIDIATNTVTITDSEVTCYTGDEIQIVQFY